MGKKLNFKLASMLVMGLGVSLPAYSNGWYVEGYGGISNLHGGKSQVIQDKGAGTIYEDYFYKGSGNDSQPLYGFGVGYQWDSTGWLYQLGINYYKTDSQEIKGDIASIEPQFGLTDYRYKISSQRLMLSGRALFKTNTSWLPYISGGVGYSRNEFSDYSVGHLSETSFSDVEHFSDNSRNKLAWQVGLGVLYQFNSQLSLSAGYQYVDLGEAESGGGSSSGHRFQTGDLYANEVTLGVNYRF